MGIKKLLDILEAAYQVCLCGSLLLDVYFYDVIITLIFVMLRYGWCL